MDSFAMKRADRVVAHSAGSDHNHPLARKGPVMANADSIRAPRASKPKPLNIGREISAMQRMTVGQLRAKYADVFGEPTRSRHKEYLIKRIAWRMQANAEGDLSERARKRAMELANDAELRLTPPREPKPVRDAEQRTKTVATKVRPGTDLLPGTTLKREYKGRTVRVKVLADAFECDGERYKSLTAVAKAVTGKHWNGYHFFGLRRNGGDR